MDTPRQFEGKAFRILQKLNQDYFGNAANVVGVRLAKFDKRGSDRVTLGMFDSGTGIIYLNYHMRYLLGHSGRLRNEFVTVLWHELCHAFLLTAKMPIRFGLYRVLDDHGAEFYAEYNRRAGNSTSEAMSALFNEVHMRQSLLQDS